MNESSQPDDFWARTRALTDPLHDMIELPASLFGIIDTPQFQRLRDVHQMGVVQYVYPGGVVNRFTHCIGTAHLSQQWIRKFKDRQPSLDITEQDILNVTTAGLVHDIGHAAHSHSFEHWMHASGFPEWNHEVMGGRLFDYLIEVNNLDWELEDIRRVRGMVLGDVVDKEKPWLSQIVANHISGIDTDKFDYLRRDPFHLGIPTNFRPSRLIENSRIIGGDICFMSKEAFNIYELFHSRFSLHKRVYQHRICHAVEYMIGDVLTAIDPYMKISEWANDVERYHLLTDSLFGTIKQDRDIRSDEARDILERLDRRQLYPMICEFIVDSENLQQLESLTREEFVSCQSGSTPAKLQLQPDDIIVHRSSINYGKGNNNPVSYVKFYSKHSSNQSFNIPKSEISALLPAHFQEHIVRIFLRGDLAKLPTAQKAGRRLIKRRHL